MGGRQVRPVSGNHPPALPGDGYSTTPALIESEQLEGKYALKRVVNPKRHERPRTKIYAVRLLKHPNIITLIDHSALSSRVETQPIT
jgi:hypothetical protein